MTALTWDAVGQRFYETGVDHGVLYIPDNSGAYSTGVAWNGLTTVTESPSGAEANPQYADNIKYLNLISVEEFGGTIEALTYPVEFLQFDGGTTVNGGVNLTQQSRKQFGLSYRSRLGNDVSGTDLGYKIHCAYGCLAQPSEKAFATINDSPEGISFSWQFTTVPVTVTSVPNARPLALLTVDSTKVAATNLTALTNALYGTAGSAPRLPLPDEIISMFAGSLTTVTPAAPTYNTGSSPKTVTIPSTVGVNYYLNQVLTVAGTYNVASGAYAVVDARPANGYVFSQPSQTNWVFGPA